MISAGNCVITIHCSCHCVQISAVISVFSAVIGVLRGNTVIVASTQSLFPPNDDRTYSRGRLRQALATPAVEESSHAKTTSVQEPSYSLVIELARNALGTGQGPSCNWPGTLLELARDRLGTR